MGLANAIKEVANRWSNRAEAIRDDQLLESILRRKASRSADPVAVELSGVVGHGRYSIDGPIGTGATGVIYSAWHTQLQRRVALKVLRSQYNADPIMGERLLHEARMASFIENQHVIEILDCGRLEDGRAFVVMEQLDGQRLSDLLDQHVALDLKTAIDIAVQLAEGLCGTHDAGVVHGDIKPDNLLLCQRPTTQHYVKIIDYGVASQIDPYPTCSRASIVCGTPIYMSPEQAVGAPLDGRSDLYSFGVVLYEMLSGSTPIRGRDPRELLGRHRSMPPIPLRSQPRSEHVPTRVEAIVHRCLEKDPARRYPSAADLLRELQFVQQRIRDGATRPPQARYSVRSGRSAAPTHVPGRASASPESTHLDSVVPRLAALSKIAPFMAAAPANDLGRPLASLPMSAVTGLTPGNNDRPGFRSSAPAPASHRRFKAIHPERSTLESRRPPAKVWSRQASLTLSLGLTLGYAATTLYTYLAALIP